MGDYSLMTDISEGAKSSLICYAAGEKVHFKWNHKDSDGWTI